ncbi:MAG TPA: amino acid adenylation domain-containing protein [Herpetosiphonaceae bacterium]
MTITEFLALLQRQGITLRVDGDRLRYRGTTQSLTPEMHAQIAARKAELIAALQHASPVSQAGPSRTSREGPLPLSFAQQRLWFIDQFEPHSAAYNIFVPVVLDGLLSIPTLERSLSALVGRHESLRTTFVSVDGQPIQQIGEPAPLVVSVHNLHDLPPDQRLDEAQRRAVAEAQQPFDLAQGPLIRAILFRLGPAEHVLAVILHHIIADGWSMGVLIRELATLYSAGGEPSALPPLPIQYADYAIWQRKRLQAEQVNLLQYWQRQLQNVPVFLDVPTDRPRPPVATFAGRTVTALLDRHQVLALQSLSQTAHTTLFMTLLAAWSVLLYRYSGQDDLIVGTPIAGRTHVELEGLIGFFVNTLALRADLSGRGPSGCTFAEMLRRMRETVLGAFTHQDLPFEQLIDALHPARDPSRPPLVQVMFVLERTSGLVLEVPGLSLRPLALELGIAKFDLSLTANEHPSGLHLALEYRTDLFDATTAERLLAQYQTLLAAILVDSQQPIDRIPLLLEAERQQILGEWNAPIAPDPRHAPIHALFAAQAARTPEAVALIQGREQLTYAALNRRANQLARYLSTLGVGPEMVVGVCLPPGCDLIVALLGILTAGGVYLPLDPSLPVERLGFIIQDAQAAVVITTTAHQLNIPPTAARLVCLDADAIRIDQEPTTDPARNVEAENLAYIIYTSGSTGMPKGVGVAHAPLARHLLTIQQAYELSPQDRVLAFAPPSFDFSIEEISATLISGACLVVRAAELWSPEVFTDVIARAALTVVHLPPVYYRAWVQAFADRADVVPPSLRLVTVGGEALTPEAVHAWQHTTLREIRLVNAYGPTETTITATIADLTAENYASAQRRNVSIGRSLPGRTAYILDDTGEPVPVGMPGELYLGGTLLARGYLQRPDLTAAAFVPDSFSQIPGARLYRTGDLARWRADGMIEFLGRIDQQVKLRGMRIEPGEIEATLRDHPAVRDALVLLRDERLVAYVVENPEPRTQNPEDDSDGSRFSGLGSSDLRSFLTARLPAALVPSAFVLLQALPLLPNGKIDRRSLPEPSLSWPDPEHVFVAPRTPLEELLSRIWMELLGVERVGIHDHFFALGGHSLLAVQLIAHIHKQVGVQLPVRMLFESPTIAGLAAAIEAAQRATADAPSTTPAPDADTSLASLTAHIDALRWAASMQAPTAHPTDSELYEGGEL